jgi:uncharacterized membrane protein YphA (DoxX/SURF4 family)
MAYDVLFLIGRLIAGGYYVMSGANHFLQWEMMTGYAKSKNVPAAKWAVAFSGLLLLLGGASVLTGVYPQLGVLCISAFFVSVTFKMHDYWNAEKDQRMSQKINFMKNLALLGSALMWLAIQTPWPLSLGF